MGDKDETKQVRVKGYRSATVVCNCLIVVQDFPRVTGVGGVFFKSKNPAGMREWYNKNLGKVVYQTATDGLSLCMNNQCAIRFPESLFKSNEMAIYSFRSGDK